MFPPHLAYPPPKTPLRIPLIIREEEGMCSKSSFLIGQMFVEDPEMKKMEEECPGLVFNLPNIYSDAITRPDGPRDLSGLVAFLSMKVEMPIATLL